MWAYVCTNREVEVSVCKGRASVNSARQKKYQEPQVLSLWISFKGNTELQYAVAQFLDR